MAQFGKNAGPKHVSLYGIATSIVNKTKYSSAEVLRKDLTALGIMSFLYNKFLTHAAKEIVDEHTAELERDGLEPIEATQIPQGLHALFDLFTVMTIVLQVWDIQ